MDILRQSVSFPAPLPTDLAVILIISENSIGLITPSISVSCFAEAKNGDIFHARNKGKVIPLLTAVIFPHNITIWKKIRNHKFLPRSTISLIFTLPSIPEALCCEAS